jgi:hypothetical protein
MPYKARCCGYCAAASGGRSVFEVVSFHWPQGLRHQSAGHKLHALVVRFDATLRRSFHTRIAGARIEGPGYPCFAASYDSRLLVGSQKGAGKGFSVRAEVAAAGVDLGDRRGRWGFGRTELARACQELGFHYLIRIQLKVFARCWEFCGNLRQLLLWRGAQRLLRGVPFARNMGERNRWFAGARACRKTAMSAGSLRGTWPPRCGNSRTYAGAGSGWRNCSATSEVSATAGR